MTGAAAPAVHADRAPAPIEVAGVTKTFPGGVTALSGASFTIREGERACLLGPNGAGKTTLIRLVTGALKPTRGAVRLFGLGVDARDFLAARRRVGIVPQAPGMYRDITVREYLTLVARLYQRPRAAIDEVVAAFGLGPFVPRALAQLSGGYQRRLALAAAMLPSPDLLLLDEPTVGLDPVATREVHDYLRATMPGRTTVLCTHNLAEAEALCTSAVILRDGQVLVHEPIERLRARAAPHLVLAAREGAGALAAALRARGLEPVAPPPGAVTPAGDATEAGEGDGAVHVAVADPRGVAPELLRALLDAGLHVYECRALTPRLEDLFLQVVGDGAVPAGRRAEAGDGVDATAGR